MSPPLHVWTEKTFPPSAFLWSVCFRLWRIPLFESSSRRHPTSGLCQTETAVGKHLITACIDSQDCQSKQSLKCLCWPAITSEVSCRDTEPKKREENERKRGQWWIWLILRQHLSHMSVQVTTNLSQFASGGDKRADALCRLAVITDGIPVRGWMCLISGFTFPQTPVAVLKVRLATSQAERCVQQKK